MTCAYIDFGHLIFIFNVYWLRWPWAHEIYNDNMIRHQWSTGILRCFHCLVFSSAASQWRLRAQLQCIKMMAGFPVRSHHHLCLPLGLAFVLFSSDLCSSFSSVLLKLCEILKWIQSETCKTLFKLALSVHHLYFWHKKVALNKCSSLALLIIT